MLKNRRDDMKQACVFIQANDKQMLGAIVARYALRRMSRNNERFEVHILHSRDYSFLAAREGQWYRRDGGKRRWLNEDLQSFTPLRFMPPELMGYAGRALVIDPDVFAVGDVWDLLSRDMQGRSILCRKKVDGAFASSVMLLDCGKLTHWRCEEAFEEMFDFNRDYADWMWLRLEPRGSIGLFEKAWNDFDRLNARTKLLHNTRRLTQPWKTGLAIDWTPSERFRMVRWLMQFRRNVFGEYALLGTYRRHPDRKQERFFFSLLRECLSQGILSEAYLRDEMRRNHLRHDALQVIEHAPPLAAQLPAATTANAVPSLRSTSPATRLATVERSSIGGSSLVGNDSPSHTTLPVSTK
jgi:hypothetical protein